MKKFLSLTLISLMAMTPSARAMMPEEAAQVAINLNVDEPCYSAFQQMCGEYEQWCWDVSSSPESFAEALSEFCGVPLSEPAPQPAPQPVPTGLVETFVEKVTNLMESVTKAPYESTEVQMQKSSSAEPQAQTAPVAAIFDCDGPVSLIASPALLYANDTPGLAEDVIKKCGEAITQDHGQGEITTSMTCVVSWTSKTCDHKANAEVASGGSYTLRLVQRSSALLGENKCSKEAINETSIPAYLTGNSCSNTNTPAGGCDEEGFGPPEYNCRTDGRSDQGYSNVIEPVAFQFSPGPSEPETEVLNNFQTEQIQLANLLSFTNTQIQNIEANPSVEPEENQFVEPFIDYSGWFCNSYERLDLSDPKSTTIDGDMGCNTWQPCGIWNAEQGCYDISPY